MSPLVEPQPGNRFVSFVHASGRGGAKLYGRARGDKIVVLGLLRVSFVTPAAPAAPPAFPCPRRRLSADNLRKPM